MKDRSTESAASDNTHLHTRRITMAKQTQSTAVADPRADRPQMPEGYGVPASDEGLLP